MTEFSIGVDLGGTNLRAAAIDRAGKMIAKVSRTTVLTKGPDSVVGDIVAGIRAVQRSVKGHKLVGVGIGSAGFMDMQKGVIRGSPNLPIFEDYPIRDEISRRLGLPVILENDANAAALGEKWMGAGKNYDDLVLLTLGTGIGGGIIVHGRILHGFVGMAAEVGHITVDPSGNPCGCGNNGCLEKHASATAVVCMAKLMGLGEVSAEDVFHLAEQGDEKAHVVWRHMGKHLGVGLAALANIFNCPLYLLSGGLLPAWDYFTPAMFEELKRRSFIFRSTPSRVEKAVLGSEAGLYGAAYLPLQEQA
jgi:glucokinase